ncbi:MAG: dihydroneopterin aldolase [Propioniciclava sp.]
MTQADQVTISLTGVSATGNHGVLPAERRDGQRFVVDAVLTIRRPARSDDLATTLDYGTAAQTIVTLIEGKPVELIETLAELIAEALCQEPMVVAAIVTVHKPAAPLAVDFMDVSVTVTRTCR